jgi:acetyl coenzyme A synthetase (ADP forming)-like protein
LTTLTVERARASGRVATAKPAASLAAILAPRSIAVVGASRRADAMGHQILHNLISYEFKGAVYPVNPNARSICAVRAYPSVADLPEHADVAVIVVPKEQVLDAAEACGAAGVKGLIVISAGFRESGSVGSAREQRLMEIVRRHGMRMVGPNCMGVVNVDPAVSMNATFATTMPPFGHAAFVSQSGALGMSVLDSAREYGIGMSQFVSIGNKPDVSGNDLLEYWEHDPSVTVILMYVENFGNPARFREVAGRITKTKPIIIVKSGRSRAGARAATSHTGALAASDTAVDALLAQAGVLRAATIEELFDMAMGFEVRVRPRSRRTAVLTNAGGPGILAADALDAYGLDLVELGQATVDRLRPLFPAEASIRNPLDMIASATPAGYTTAMTALLADPAVDAVVPIFVPPFGIKQEDVAAAIVSAAATATDKVVLAVLMGREGLPQGRAELHEVAIPTYIFPESAARALAALNRHAEWAALPPATYEPLEDVDRVAARALLDDAKRDGREQLTVLEALDLLRAYRIPVAASRVATDVDAAARHAAKIGYPIVLKVVSPDIVHKTDVGGVRVGIASETELRQEYRDMLARLKKAAPTARVNGILVQPMVRGQCETIAGITRDPSFGPLVMFGLGGIFVEALRDVVFRLAPVSETEAMDMIANLRGAALFAGMRGSAPADRAALALAVRRLGQLAVECPDILELDVNPLLALESGVVALDARVRVRTAPDR